MVTDIRTKIEEREQQKQKDVLIKRAQTIFSRLQNIELFSTLLRMIEEDPDTTKTLLDVAEEKIQKNSFETKEFQRSFSLGVLCGVVLGFSVGITETLLGFLHGVEDMDPNTLRETLLTARDFIEKHNVVFKNL